MILTRDMTVTMLCVASIIGGTAATTRVLGHQASLVVEGDEQAVMALADDHAAAGESTLRITESGNPRASVVVSLKPEQFTAWALAVANAIPILVAALLLAWGNYRTKRREIEAADAEALRQRLSKIEAANESKSGEVAAIKHDVAKIKRDRDREREQASRRERE